MLLNYVAMIYSTYVLKRDILGYRAYNMCDIKIC